MDGIRSTPMQYPLLGLLADRLKRAQQFAVAPGGYANPPAEVLLNLLGVPAIQQTMERMAYGEPLTTGRGMTTRVRPEVSEAAMTLLPAAAGVAKATKGLPVGMSIKDVGKKSIYPQEEALRLAQQRAALPKEQYGLGLPPDNTPEMRAAAMQFERRGFHETEGKNIEEGLQSFDVKRVGAAASDEQTPYAMFFKPHAEGIGIARENPAQMPLYVKSNLTDENILTAFSNRDDLQNYLNQFPEIKKATQAVRDLDNQMADYMNQIMKKADDLYKQGKIEESDKLMDQISFGSPLMKQFDDRTNELAAIAKEKITEHFKEKGIGSIGLTDDTGAFGRRTITEMVLNPNENVRSAFAAFDPWRRTAAIAAATGTLAPDLMAQEIDYTLLPPKEKKKALELFSGLLGQ